VLALLFLKYLDFFGLSESLFKKLASVFDTVRLKTPNQIPSGPSIRFLLKLYLSSKVLFGDKSFDLNVDENAPRRLKRDQNDLQPFAARPAINILRTTIH
jgi:hypothetical protein